MLRWRFIASVFMTNVAFLDVDVALPSLRCNCLAHVGLAAVKLTTAKDDELILVWKLTVI